jgi:hypothetical protein
LCPERVEELDEVRCEPKTFLPAIDEDIEGEIVWRGTDDFNSCHRWPLGGLEIPRSELFAERP